MNKPIPPATGTILQSREINLDALARDTSKFADGLCALGELIRGSAGMDVDDWGVTLSGMGDLVEVLGTYAAGLADRGHAIDQNLKAAKVNGHD